VAKLKAMQTVLENAGVEFIEGGVKVRKGGRATHNAYTITFAAQGLHSREYCSRD
jgi:hypothetical protein